MFQGTFVCVSLECEQGRVSCVIRPGNVERFFFGFVAHCLLRSLSAGFLGRHRLSRKLKRLLHMPECESSVVFVGRWSELRQRVFVEKEYCNFGVGDVPVSSPFARMNVCVQ